MMDAAQHAASSWCSVGELKAFSIAGHGYDLVNLQCAEFCVTSHHFFVNGAEHSVEYKEAGEAP